MMDKLRMAEWLVIAAALTTVLYFTAPQQLPVFLYKTNLVAFFGFMGYWIDRRLFGSDAVDAWTQIRRAIVVSAAMVAGAIAL